MFVEIDVELKEKIDVFDVVVVVPKMKWRCKVKKKCEVDWSEGECLVELFFEGVV